MLFAVRWSSYAVQLFALAVTAGRARFTKQRGCGDCEHWRDSPHGLPQAAAIEAVADEKRRSAAAQLATVMAAKRMVQNRLLYQRCVPPIEKPYQKIPSGNTKKEGF